jgi:uncharacterized glyoxalase superfamily protein PhnB
MTDTVLTDTLPATDTSGHRAATQPPTGGLVPHLIVDGAARAIDWYRDVFGATLDVRYDADDGRVGHAELTVSGSALFLADPYPEIGAHDPHHVGGTPVGLNVTVSDVDDTHAAAVAAGAISERAPVDEPYGDRAATLVDPFGHRWFVRMPIATPTVDEIEAGMPGYTVTMGHGTELAASATPSPPVELGYVTIPAPDTGAAARFYGALFGWESEAGNLGDQYRHVHNTALPFGIVPGAPTDPATLYFRVPELDPYAARVAELGGRVLERSHHPSGRGAACTDDQGCRFELWEPAPGY